MRLNVLILHYIIKLGGNANISRKILKEERSNMRKNLKNARKSASMTQRQMAEYLGISERYYQHIEAGQRTGDFALWDMLEDLFMIHQRKLREIEEHLPDKANHQEKHLK